MIDNVYGKKLPSISVIIRKHVV